MRRSSFKTIDMKSCDEGVKPMLSSPFNNPNLSNASRCPTNQETGKCLFRSTALALKAAFIFSKDSGNMTETDLERNSSTEELTSLTMSSHQSHHSQTDSGGEDNDPGHVTTGPYDDSRSNWSVDALSINIDENVDFNQPPHGTWPTWAATNLSDWMFIVSGLILEILSASFDQISSPSKPHNALISLVLAIGAVLICTWELIHNALKEIRSVPSHDDLEINSMLFGTLLPDMIGFGLAILQLICSAVQYYFLHNHANNPMKLSIVPLFFFCCLVVLKLKRN